MMYKPFLLHINIGTYNIYIYIHVWVCVRIYIYTHIIHTYRTITTTIASINTSSYINIINNEYTGHIITITHAL